MFWVLSASPCNKLLNAHLCVWEMCVFKSWSYLTAQTISSQAQKYFLSRFWFYWAVLHVPELSLASTHIHIHVHTQLRFKDHTGPLSLVLFQRCYTLCGYKRGWCREEEKILTCWQWVCTQRIVVVWARWLCRVKTPCTSIQAHWLSVAHCQEKPRFLLCICGCSSGQIYSNNRQCSVSPAEAARRFLTSAWPWVSHLTSLCLGPSGWKLGRNTRPDVVCEPGIPKSAI